MAMMTNMRITVRTALALLACLTLGLARGTAAEDDKTPPGEAGATRPAVGGDDLERLVLSRPPVPVTRPRGAGKKVPRVGSRLPVDGSGLNNRTCRLSGPDPHGWRSLLFEPGPDKVRPQPRRVLPCRLLEQMEVVVAKQPKTVFRIWGENTVYLNRLYLLPLAVSVVQDSPAPPPAKPKVPAEADKSTSPPPARPDVPAKPGEPVDVDDVVRELLRDKPERAIVVPVGPGKVTKGSDGAVAPGVKSPAVRARGRIVVDRLVRMELRDSRRTWSVVRFEADNTLAEPPMRLLPCGKLARAEALEADGLLRVTGRVTSYKGHRYLLLRKVLGQHRLGRF